MKILKSIEDLNGKIVNDSVSFKFTTKIKYIVFITNDDEVLLLKSSTIDDEVTLDVIERKDCILDLAEKNLSLKNFFIKNNIL